MWSPRFQRIFKVSSPTAGGFYSVIVGADKCLAEPGDLHARRRRGRRRGGGHRHHQSDAARRRVLRQARRAPCRDPAGRFAAPRMSGTKPLPGTGAYMISAYDPNKGLRWSRNPHFKEWSEDAQPDGYPDVVQYDFGLTEEAEVTAVAERPGRLDVRPAADRPPRRDRHQVQGPGAYQHR